MMFPDKPKTLPYLADYLQVASSRRNAPMQLPTLANDMTSAAVMGGGVGFLTFFASGQTHMAAAILAGGAAFAIGAVGAVRAAANASRSKPLEEDQRLENESREVTLRMNNLMHKRRLHRDLSPEVAAVLEEAATQWSRARAALLSPYWTRTDLAPHLQTVREQALRAVERIMQELLVLFATAVPEQPGNWNLAEVVDEAIGKSVFATAPNRRLSVFHTEAVDMVRRMQELADEAERISLQLVNDPNLGVAAKPGASLEATLSELRSVRQAEEELRQDIRL